MNSPPKSKRFKIDHKLVVSFLVALFLVANASKILDFVKDQFYTPVLDCGPVIKIP
jgi:hypothetical protein